MQDYSPEQRPVIIEWPDGQKRSRTSNLLRRTGGAVRTANATIRTRMAEPKTRRGSDDYGPSKPSGYILDENYVQYKDNSGYWVAGSLIAFVLALVLVASRAGGVKGLGLILLIAIFTVMYQWYKKRVEPKIEAIARFTKKFRR